MTRLQPLRLALKKYKLNIDLQKKTPFEAKIKQTSMGLTLLAIFIFFSAKILTNLTELKLQRKARLYI